MEILFDLGSEYLTDKILNDFLRLVVENYNEAREFGAEIIAKMKGVLEKGGVTDFTVKLAVWILGEIGSSFYYGKPEQLMELYKIVNKCLDIDFENKDTRNWVIDAIVKLSSTEGFTSHSNVKVTLDTYVSAPEITTYQRTLCMIFLVIVESKKLAKYNAALKKSSDINFDEDLSFLDSFIAKAKLNGAKEYKKIAVKENV